jgi:hypothetical protein
MARQKCQFAIDFVLNTFFRDTFIKWLIVIVKNFKIVLTATNIASISGNSDFWFNLTGLNNYSFNNDK